MLRLLAAAALALVPAACGNTTQDKITIICGADEQWCVMMASRFAEQTGIDADFARLSSGDALDRIRRTRSAPEYDVWHGGPADAYAAAAREGLLEPYRSPMAAHARQGWGDPSGAWTGVYGGVLAFCNNVRKLTAKGLGPLLSWQELLDPRLAGSVGIAHPATSGTAYTALWTQVELGGSAEAGLDYLRRLHPNVLRYNRSGAAAAEQAARGEVAVGVTFSHDCVDLQEQGFRDLQVSFPAEGSGYEVGGVAVLAGTRHPEAARRFVDWALSGDSQRLGPLAGFYALPASTEVAPDSKAADLAQVRLIGYDFTRAGAAKSELTRRFGAEIAPPPER
ncbi:extracellular solute-binding protein [Nonomuraea sp. NPDC050328]|uniref:extracellular solute-binding protein n=1 Tax=Nonomuraea sp. NPDC050328 TaxID=3364361 RepID=UPI003796B562